MQRDLKIIYSVYGVEIKHDRSIGKYRIINDDQSILQQRLLEAVGLYNALSLKDKISDKLIFEQRRPQGTQHLVSILNAIKEKKQIKGKDADEYRSKLESYRKSIKLIDNRINQMGSYARTRASLSKGLKPLKHFLSSSKFPDCISSRLSPFILSFLSASAFSFFSFSNFS